MAFTGDLENLYIADIIQLLHTTRKSGIFSVRGSKGESRIIFSNGYIVGANHLNSKVRIGTVLVKMNAITIEDLKLALEAQKKAGKNRKPLIATLIDMGRLKQEEAYNGLKKLIEITVVELIGWTKGTFTLDTEDIVVTPERTYPLSKMEQELSLDAQMALMDALRVFDEREHDRRSGKIVPSDEELFVEALPGEVTTVTTGEKTSITADDLGLADIDRLERKMPQSFSVEEIFDPIEIHRQKIKETLAGFSAEEQQTFVSFLRKSTSSINVHDVSKRQEGLAGALVFISGDELIRHSVMTICKNEGVLVFVAEKEEELDRIITQCLSMKALTVLVFDNPETKGEVLSEEKIISLRRQLKKKYPQASIVQIASPHDFNFMLASFNDGVRAVLPKPSKNAKKETFIKDTIKFLETFKSYIRDIFHEQKEPAVTDIRLAKLRDSIIAIRDLNDPTDVSYKILQSVSEMCERSINFIVRQSELIGEISVGVNAEKNIGPASAGKLKIPLTKPSVFRDVVEKGKLFYGESNDEILKVNLFKEIGAPLRPAIILLPVKSRGRTIALTYGDFAKKEPSSVQTDLLEILANQAGLVLENILYRKHINKGPKK